MIFQTRNHDGQGHLKLSSQVFFLKLIPVIEKNPVNSCESLFNFKLKFLNYKNRYLYKTSGMKLLTLLISTTLASSTLVPVEKLPSLDFYHQLVMDHGAAGFDTMAVYRVSVDGNKVKPLLKGDSAFDSEIGEYGQEFGHEFVKISMSLILRDSNLEF